MLYLFHNRSEAADVSMAKKRAIPRKARRRKKARSDDADVVLKELLRAIERAHAGNRN